MSVQETIFNRMTHQNEDNSSELLVNLMQQKFFRDLCLRWLLTDTSSNIIYNIDTVINSIKKSHISTQRSYGEYGRPDITIDNDKYFFLIENKIHKNTPLQQNQIDNYKKIIFEQEKLNKTARLIFLVPNEEYAHHKEIEKIQNDTIEVSSNQQYRRVIIKYWNRLLEFLYSQQINTISSLYDNSLEYLNSIIDLPVIEETTLNSMETVMLYNTTEYIYDVYSLANKVTALCEEFVKDLPKDKFIFGCCTNNIYEIGIYFTRLDTNNGNYFIGLAPAIHKEHNKDEKFTFQIAFKSNKDYQSTNDNICSIKDGNSYWICMPLEKINLANTDADKQEKDFFDNANEVLGDLCKLEDDLNPINSDCNK